MGPHTGKKLGRSTVLTTAQIVLKMLAFFFDLS
jgi:hypothetical protein